MRNIRILILASIAAIIFSPFILEPNRVSTDIAVLLPHDKWITDHLNFIRNSQIGSISAISIEAENASDAPAMLQYAAEFADALKKHPHVTDIFFRISPEMCTDAAAFLCPRAPQILTEKEISSIQNLLNSEEIDAIIKEHYQNLMRPGGLFRQKMVAYDPLNQYQKIVEKIKNTGKGSGFRAVLKDNTLWSEDGKHLLILVYTDIPVTDAVKGAAYLRMLKKSLKKFFPTPRYSYILISGHSHAVENRRLLRHDIFITLTVASLGFLLLFILLFKDWRAVFVFIIPIIGMLCAVALTLLFFKRPSAIILGMGATVIGIALDYGIHVFISLKYTENRNKALQEITRPLLFSALTTLGVFWAFFFSGTPGYHQLAFASTCGIAISLILSLICLPMLIPAKSKEGKSVQRLNLSYPEFTNSSARTAVIIWLSIITLSLFSIFFTGFEPDIRKLDGAEKILKPDNDRFRHIWGKNAQAVITVTGDDIEDVMQKQDAILSLAKANNIPGFQSLSTIWPSKKTRKKHILFWNTFWQIDDRLKKLKQELSKAGSKYGFSDNAFKPFFENIFSQNPDADFYQTEGFKLFSRKFVNIKGEKITINAFFQDNPHSVRQVNSFISKIPGTELISPRTFGRYISEKIIDDALHIAVVAIILVLLLAWLCLRTPGKTLPALIPVISALLAVFPVYAVSGLKINAIVLVAMIVVTGLAIDYGIFTVSAIKRNQKTFSRNAFSALTISMLSTIVGSGALLWAQHPALKTIGIVISIGVLSGYLSAVFVIPAVLKNIEQPEKAYENKGLPED